jgi:hypothetical protein
LTNSMSHVDKYVVAFVVVSKTPKTDIPQCAPLARLLASQYHARSGPLVSTTHPSDISRNIVMLTTISDGPIEADADAAPLPPHQRHCRRWWQTPSLPCNCFALVFDTLECCH